MITVEDVAKMSREEKWEALNLLQTSLEGDDPPWVEGILKERAAKIERGEAVYTPWEEVKARFEGLSRGLK